MWMVEARQRSDWDHTAALMCLIVNAFKDKHAPKATVEQLNPFREHVQQRRPHRLRELLPDGNGRSN